LGTVCELYRMSDTDINRLSRLSHEEAEEFLDEKYANVDGELHKENDTVFYMDKGWDVTKFLLQKVDPSKDKILNGLNSRFIKSNDTELINGVLEKITIDSLIQVLDTNEMIENEVYWAEIEDKDYINFHLKAYKAGFKKASESNSGLVIYFY